MKLVLATLALIAAAQPALAQRRPPNPSPSGPPTPSMTCAQATSLVNRAGAIVLHTGPDLYDRYVANETFCPTGLYTKPAFVPTRDNPQCVIGYYCTANSPFWR